MMNKFRNLVTETASMIISTNEQQEYSNSTTVVADQENFAESPPSSNSTAAFNIDDCSLASPSNSSSAKRSSKRAIQKRVVQIPIKETEGSRLKGENNTPPPSDSWAWRKYGQKPIKGSPYPRLFLLGRRGYYRCSSSKGCPARKQVERSRVDPTMLVVTYSSDHNHPWPVSRSNNHHRHATKKPELDPIEPEEEKFTRMVGDELGWFGEMETTTSPTMLESPIMAEYDVSDMASVLLPMGEEEASLFADLGELPECSTVFRHGLFDDHQRFTAPWCGTTT